MTTTQQSLKNGSMFLETLGGEIMSDDEDFFSSDDDNEPIEEPIEHEEQASISTKEQDTDEQHSNHNNNSSIHQKFVTLKEKKKFLKNGGAQQQQQEIQQQQNSEDEDDEKLQQQAMIEKISKSNILFPLTEQGKNSAVSIDTLHPSWSIRIRKRTIDQMKKYVGKRMKFGSDGSTIVVSSSSTHYNNDDDDNNNEKIEKSNKPSTTKTFAKTVNGTATNYNDIHNRHMKSNDANKTIDKQVSTSFSSAEKTSKTRTRDNQSFDNHKKPNAQQSQQQFSRNNTTRSQNQNGFDRKPRIPTAPSTTTTNNNNNKVASTNKPTVATDVIVHPSILEKRKQRGMLENTNWTGKKIVFGKPK